MEYHGFREEKEGNLTQTQMGKLGKLNGQIGQVNGQIGQVNRQIGQVKQGFETPESLPRRETAVS